MLLHRFYKFQLSWSHCRSTADCTIPAKTHEKHSRFRSLSQERLRVIPVDAVELEAGEVRSETGNWKWREHPHDHLHRALNAA